MAVAAARRRVFGMTLYTAPTGRLRIGLFSSTGSLLAPALALAWLLASAPARAANYWVGNNGNPPCTHATLQAAIETAVGGAGDDVISLVGAGPFTGPFTVFGGGIHIRGNVGSCGSGTSVGYATLRAPSGSRPLTILMGGPETVRLHRVVVTTENGTYNGDGGAIWFAGASNASKLELLDSQVVNNTAAGEGGGVYVSAGTLSVSTAAMIGFNQAVSGGGIGARNGARVEVRGGLITNNTALFDGGGVYAPDAQVILQNSSPSTFTVVTRNLAGQDGGGLYLGGDYANSIDAIAGEPAEVSRNLAQRGGGLFIDGSTVMLERAWLALNEAFGDGGGAYVGDDGALVSNAFEAPRPTLGGFPRVETNTAGEGAAFYAADGAEVFLGSGRIRDHDLGADGALVATAVGTGALWFYGVAFESNTAPALFGVADAAALTLHHVSFSGNTLGGFVRWRGSASQVSAEAIALDESEPFFLSVENPAQPPAFWCVVTKFVAPFVNPPPGTTVLDLVVLDPQFTAPPGDLHLRPTSPAIDRCISQSGLDLDGDAFNHDDPHHPGAAGSLADAGMDEATVLFYDSFEAGTLGQWNGGHSP